MPRVPQCDNRVRSTAAPGSLMQESCNRTGCGIYYHSCYRAMSKTRGLKLPERLSTASRSTCVAIVVLTQHATLNDSAHCCREDEKGLNLDTGDYYLGFSRRPEISIGSCGIVSSNSYDRMSTSWFYEAVRLHKHTFHQNPSFVLSTLFLFTFHHLSGPRRVDSIPKCIFTRWALVCLAGSVTATIITTPILRSSLLRV